MKKIFLILITLILLCPIGLADGMVHVYDRDMWNLQSENQQLAAINYQDGFENMLISISIPGDVSGDKAVWIFPIPSRPDNVVIDNLKGFPRFWGVDVDSEFNDAVTGTGLFMTGYSLFPISIPIVAIWVFFYPRVGMFSGMESGVTVHERVEKMGLITELITTKSQEDLSLYLQNKELELPQDSKEMLGYYVGKDYSFVVSYISDLEQFKQESKINEGQNYGFDRYSAGIPLGVFVKFPTDEIYFPLKPTSVYGNEEIPILIYLVGHVTPKLYPEIKQKSEVTYYEGSLTAEPGISRFFNENNRLDDLKYTKIKLNVSSKYLTEDLWIENSAPLSVSVKSTLINLSWVWGITLFVILSIISSLLAGIISFRQDSLPRKKLMLQGLWNCFTFIGFVIKMKEIKLQARSKSQGANVILRGIRNNRKILYAFLFYVFFILLVIASLSLLIQIFK